MVKRVKGLMRYLVERKGDTVTDVGWSRERRWVTTVSCMDMMEESGFELRKWMCNEV